MIALALTLSLVSGGLLAEQSPSTFSARLITGATQGDLESMSRSELEMERASLLDSRPGIGGGIGLLAGGGGLTLFLGLPFLLFSVYVEGIVVGIVLTVLGVGAMVTGLVLIFTALAERRTISARVQAIDERIKRMEMNEVPPPPPPPPPPGAWLMQVEPSMVVASF